MDGDTWLRPASTINDPARRLARRASSCPTVEARNDERRSGPAREGPRAETPQEGWELLLAEIDTLLVTLDGAITENRLSS